MAMANAYAQYNNNKIMTASPGELTLMLYDGAIKFCNAAIVAVEKKDIQGAHTNIIKVQKIIDYLRQTLDMRYEVAKDFENIYVYLAQRLVTANIKKDKVLTTTQALTLLRLRGYTISDDNSHLTAS